MINKDDLLKQFKKDILKIKDNDSKKIFYTITYNILKRSLDDKIILYNSDFTL